jgi:hypothetical protein
MRRAGLEVGEPLGLDAPPAGLAALVGRRRAAPE